MEAVFVRDLGIAEMIIQARSYHAEGNCRKDLAGFWDRRSLGRIRNEGIKRLVTEMISKGR